MMNGENNAMDIDKDRREYFRIDDSLHLSYRVVDSEAVPELSRRLHAGEANAFSVMANLCAIGQQLNASMRRIETTQPDIAAYLKSLDKKIDLLGRVFLASESDLSAMPAQPVNLSGGGLAMHSSETLESGVSVEIKILLDDTFTGIVAYGEVINCVDNEEGGDYPYLLRIKFTHIRPCDQDALVRHILARQSEMIRQERERREKM